MHFSTVLNRDGGTLRTTDIEQFATRLRQTLEGRGHSCTVAIVGAGDIEWALKAAAAEDGVDVVMAGGGDGTVSAAAGILRGTERALAVLPAGTMNLFARSLGIPLDLDAAVGAFASGRIRQVDTASANGQPFVHQFSIGMHAKMVRLRERLDFASRLGKIGASAKAAYWTVLKPPRMRVALKMGETEILATTSNIGVTNNLFGEGHLPYADHPDGGMLGIYVTVARQRGEIVRHALNVAIGRWQDNDLVEIHQADRVTLRILSPLRSQMAVIDGELQPAAAATEISIEPASLRVLVPG